MAGGEGGRARRGEEGGERGEGEGGERHSARPVHPFPPSLPACRASVAARRGQGAARGRSRLLAQRWRAELRRGLRQRAARKAQAHGVTPRAGMVPQAHTSTAGAVAAAVAATAGLLGSPLTSGATEAVPDGVPASPATGEASPSALLRAAEAAGVPLADVLNGTNDWFNVPPPVRAAVASLLDAHAAQAAEVAALRAVVMPLVESVSATRAASDRAAAEATAAHAAASRHDLLLEKHAQQMVRLSGSVGAVDAHALNLSQVAMRVQELAMTQTPPASPGEYARSSEGAHTSTPIRKVKEMIAEHVVRATHAADLAIEPLERRTEALEAAVAALRSAGDGASGGRGSFGASTGALHDARAAQEAAARAEAAAERAQAAANAAVSLSPSMGSGDASASNIEARLSAVEAAVATLRTEASGARIGTASVDALPAAGLERRIAEVEMSSLRRDERENGRFSQLLNQFEGFMNDKVSKAEFEMELTLLNAKLEAKLDGEVFKRHRMDSLAGTPPLSSQQSPIKLTAPPPPGDDMSERIAEALRTAASVTATPSSSPGQGVAQNRLDGRRPSSGGKQRAAVDAASAAANARTPTSRLRGIGIFSPLRQ